MSFYLMKLLQYILRFSSITLLSITFLYSHTVLNNRFSNYRQERLGHGKRISDSLSLCTKIISQEWKNSKWQNLEQRNWKFNEDNFIVEFVRQEYTESCFMPVFEMRRKIIDQGRIVEEVGRKLSETNRSRWTELETGGRTYYDTLGRIFRTEYYYIQNKDSNYYIQRTIFQDSGNCTRREIHQKMVMDNWVDDRIEEYYLNKDGSPIKHISKTWDEKGVCKIREYVYTYDTFGREIEMAEGLKNREVTSYSIDGRTTDRIRQEFSFGGWVNQIRTVTYLNDDSDIAEIISQFYSSAAGWKNYIRYLYYYDRVLIKPPIQNITKEENGELSQFKLSHNYPNPFNAMTQIQFTVPRQAHVTLKIYDILGREVATLVNEIKGVGSYTAVWDGQNMASGIYYYQLTSVGYSLSRKMNLIK